MNSKSGIYIVTLNNTEPMPVTRDKRYVDICARVDHTNLKVGKAKDFEGRRKNYHKDFDAENVNFMPVLEVADEDLQRYETAIKRKLKANRLRSPKGGMLEWLHSITEAELRVVIAQVAAEEK